jgi:beta-N-acetylhexosaminidase
MQARVPRWLAWGAATVLVFVAFHLRSPYLLAWRPVETPVLLLASAVGVVVARRLGRVEGGLLAAVLGIAFVATAVGEADFRLERRAVLAADGDARTLGRHFMVGYRDFDEVARLAQRGLIGGVYLSRANVHGRSGAEIRAEVDALQALRRGAGLPPLLVAADQEGGSVAHMTPPLAALPPLSSLVDNGSDAGELDARVRAYGETQGCGLAALGVNLNFGPVADLRPSGRGPLIDTHTLIRRRAIAADPAVVERVVATYDAALLAQGVRPTLKHFPGLGRVTTDTHHFAARLDEPIARLTAADWRPFRTAVRDGAAMMLGHVVVPEIDSAKPASLSGAVVRGLLRGEWGYDGLLVTDDLNMGAVFRRGIGTAAAEALEAGVDMVLVAYDPDQYYRAMFGALQAQRRGSLDAAQLAAGSRRIAAAVPPMRPCACRPLPGRT